MKLLPTPLSAPRTRLDIDVVNRAGVAATVVQLEGDLDVETTPQLRSCVDEALRQNARDLVIDLSGVAFCESTVLGLFVGLHRRLADAGGTLELTDPPRAMRDLLAVSGLDQVLSVT